MMAAFIAVPLKRTSEIDLVKPLKYVFSGFCIAADEPVSYDDALNELNKLRINSTWKTLDKHESSLDVMTRYYDQLNFLDSKCPSVEFQVSFKWKDAFATGGIFLSSASLTLSTLSFEKICILFNIGAMQSQIACSHGSDTKNDEALKLAAKYFQLSSGTFQHLKSLISTPVIKDPTPDLQSETLNALQALMLAQAQESFFYKAASDNMKESIIAKVASRCEELYGDAVKHMQKEHVLSLWEKDWLSIVSAKESAFCALAEYYQSLVCRANKDVGEELARLQRAVEMMRLADSKACLSSHFKDYYEKMSHNYEEAKKDNDFIYHARIPDLKSLQPIGKAALAKSIIPADKLNPNSRDLFSALLPMAVQQAMSAFDIRKMEIVKVEKEKLQSETQMLNGILASLNLPAALEDTTGNSLPQSLREKSHAVREAGGLVPAERLLNELPALLKRNSEILQESEKMLRDEQESDEQLRRKFGSNWIRTPSSKLNEPLMNNLHRFSNVITTAMSADGIMNTKYEAHKDNISLLCLSEEDLLQRIPTGNPIASCSSSEQLKGLMKEVDALKRDRDLLLGELESAATDMRAKFLSALSQEGGVNEEALSVETLGEIYGPIQKQIRENIAKQIEIVTHIQRANDEFCKEKNTSGGGAASGRETLLSELALAYDAYIELNDNLEEGTKFYNNLTEILVTLQNKINDFCFARKTEKEELCLDLQKNIVSEATQPSPLAPPQAAGNQKPARPPPPKTESSQPPQNWSYPSSAPNMNQQPPQLPYPTFSNYPYAYPTAQQAYPYPQTVLPPFPPAPGYQGQPSFQNQPNQQPQYGTYPPPGNYPYPHQPYRPWPPQ